MYHKLVTPRMRRVLFSSYKIGSTYSLKIECRDPLPPLMKLRVNLGVESACNAML